MALLFMDGFDTNDSALKWTGGTPTYAVATRFGVGSAMSPQNSVAPSKQIPASSQVFVGFALDWRDNAAARDFLSLWGDSGTTQHLTLNVKATAGTIELRRGTVAGTILATSTPNVLPLGGWAYVEMSATIADTGGAVEVRVNGVSVLTYTGDTKNAGTATSVDAVKLSSATNNASMWAYDDLYVCDGVGSVNNTFLGDVRVQTLLPTGAGASTQLTPSVGSNWDNVNDSPYSSATYNSSATTGQRDTYALSDLLSGTGTVMGIQDNILALKSDAGAASIKAALKSGATVYYDSPVTLGTTLSASVAVREVDPATAAAWTITGVDALEFGAEVV